MGKPKITGGNKGMSASRAKAVLKAEKSGAKVPAEDARDARRTAAEHYGQEASRARSENN